VIGRKKGGQKSQQGQESRPFSGGTYSWRKLRIKIKAPRKLETRGKHQTLKEKGKKKQYNKRGKKVGGLNHNHKTVALPPDRKKLGEILQKDKRRERNMSPQRRGQKPA